MMNIGVCMPEPGFLEGLRDLCTREGSVLIFDEVKTGSKLAAGGAFEFFGVKPDLVTMAKSFGGGAPIAAFGGRAEVMASIERFEVFHAGTYNAGPLAVAAALAALKEVLTPDIFPKVRQLNQRMIDGYNRIIDETGLPAHATGVGANGCIYFTRERVRNYRDFLARGQGALLGIFLRNDEPRHHSRRTVLRRAVDDLSSSHAGRRRCASRRLRRRRQKPVPRRTEERGTHLRLKQGLAMPHVPGC